MRLPLRLRFGHPLARLLRVRGIVLFPYVLFSESRENVSPTVLRHEMIHVRQVRRLGWWRFYTRYLLEYARHRMKLGSHDAAYLAISFEREAYENEARVALTESEKAEIGLV